MLSILQNQSGALKYSHCRMLHSLTPYTQCTSTAGFESADPVMLWLMVTLDMASPVANPAWLPWQISLIVGLMYVTVGTLRLGFLTNFLSRSVIAGFTCGAALVIGVSQAMSRRAAEQPTPALSADNSPVSSLMTFPRHSTARCG